MNSLDDHLAGELTALRNQTLYRTLREAGSPQGPRLTMDGNGLLNFSSNDYLGLADDPALKAAAIRAVKEFGAGSGASRLVCGSLSPHHELERALAEFKRTEAALTFSTGFAAALGTIGALMRSGDVVILDKLAHACIVDAARQCGARLRVFAHNDLGDLEAKLQWAKERKQDNPDQRTLVATESVFSMDGDRAPLKDIVRVKNQYGAWLMLDEAHATGVLGKEGRGLADEANVSGQVEIQMGPLGKAAGASGGFICGSRSLIEFLVNRARTFIFSTAPVPAAAGAALEGVRLIRSAEGEARRARLRALANYLLRQLGAGERPFVSAIIPLIAGAETEALRISRELQQRGILIPAIRYPTVARGEARLRVTLSATHTFEDIDSFVRAFRDLSLKVRASGTQLHIS